MATNEEVMVYFKGVDNVSSTANNIKRNVSGIGDTASGIRGKISGIASSFDMVSSAITGVLGGMSLMEQATSMWEAATQRQSSQLYLISAFGEDAKDKAIEMQGKIQDIVSQVPGDDTFMNVILSGALAKQTDLSNDKLKEGANAIADYLAGSEMQGKNAMEAQQDMKSYILSGSTSELERSSILTNQVDKLKDQATVYDRINALNDALKAEGFAGLSEADSAANAMTEFQGHIEKAQADLGTVFLPYVQDILKGFNAWDTSVGGGLSMAIVGVGTALSGVVTGIGTIGTAFTGLNSMIETFGMIKEVLFGAQAAEEALTATTAVSTGVTEAQTSVTSLLAESQMAAALSEAGLTESEVANMAAMYGATDAIVAQEAATTALDAGNLTAIASQMGLSEAELSSAIAHASNIPVLEAEGVAAETSSAGFWSMAAAEIATLWPILAIAAAVAALIVIIEQIGESLGWWTDFSTMLDAIKAGVMRLWDAFMNSPQVQGTLAAIQGAFNNLMSALQPVFSWLTAAWNNLFKSEGAGSGGPDVVRMIIDVFGQLGSIAGQVFGLLQQGFQTVSYVITPLLNGLWMISVVFSQLADGSMSWQDAFIQVITIIWSALTNFGSRVGQIALQIGARILSGIVNYVRQIPGRLWSFLNLAVGRLVMFATVAAVRARYAGMRIVNGIINYIRQLPGRVGQFMMQLPGRIAAAAGAAVSAATSLATQVVNAVKNGIVGLAQTVYNEFMSIPDKINSAVSNAVQAAANFGNDIKDAVLNALNIASPGIIQKKIAIEFADIPGRIGESNKYVYSAARDYAGNILRGFNAPQMDIRTLGVIRQNSDYTPSPSNHNTTIIHVHENAVPVDARNMTKQEAQGVITYALEDLFSNPEGAGGV
ncbi:hypothetical protein [Methanobrevibacter sp.]|uniref:phage tail protein n=1 Tax=Methanobrevibacter sp. TaxID=66852 RepID=UPI003890825B